jgi:hypothetical protein
LQKRRTLSRAALGIFPEVAHLADEFAVFRTRANALDKFLDASAKCLLFFGL